MTISYSQEPGLIFAKASFVCPCNEYTWNSLYIASESNSFAGFHVIHPPSAVVKFLTAWNENDAKSANLATEMPSRVVPIACAQSETTMTRLK